MHNCQHPRRDRHWLRPDVCEPSLRVHPVVHRSPRPPEPRSRARRRRSGARTALPWYDARCSLSRERGSKTMAAEIAKLCQQKLANFGPISSVSAPIFAKTFLPCQVHTYYEVSPKISQTLINFCRNFKKSKIIARCPCLLQIF